jgi:glycosyltransferase involved in cell wall biosynthesis
MGIYLNISWHVVRKRSQQREQHTRKGLRMAKPMRVVAGPESYGSMAEPKNKPEITVVVPVLNGQSTLRDLFVRTRAVMSAMRLEFEIIFVDDGSVDDSWRIIGELKSDCAECVRGFKLAQNSGQQAATMCGLQRARGDWVVTLDDDLQSPPEEIPKLWDVAQSQRSDVVYGVYPVPRRYLLRNFGSRIFRLLVREVAPRVPAGSSFRLIRAEVLEALDHRLGTWAFVDPALACLTSEIAMVTVRHEERGDGKSGYSMGKLIQLAVTVLAIHSTLPLQLMIWCGLFSAIGSFCIGIYYLVLRLTSSVAVGFSALIVTMTFAFGVILLSLGILGIYVSRIYVMGTGQPGFRVKTEI